MSAARWVPLWFRSTAIYGAVALVLAALAPPPAAGQLDHYGFIFTALAFQAVFWLIDGACRMVQHQQTPPFTAGGA